ncbi:hypothetical protein COL55_13320 [Bacillus toyonensis]|jgi:hypothetical protein|uniref:hypothetical protein n=1 Tax=Bacillus toyonensis TaxID=155322 RepID=UPI000BF221FA|nr:hypothetical protein [Bacillus toyonensis]PEL23435.1 hypothetical protein CN624_21280 [Bacillus toyonensis]PFY49082.1 hypothetical protein COL55_13320 [Bacillus toyonensis]
MSILNDAFRPNKDAAKEHIKLTIKYYSGLESISLDKQLEIASRGLYVAGFSKEEARQIMREAKEEMK